MSTQTTTAPASSFSALRVAVLAKPITVLMVIAAATLVAKPVLLLAAHTMPYVALTAFSTALVIAGLRVLKKKL